MMLFQPTTSYAEPWSGRLLVLSPGDIPTVDFYIRSRVAQSADVRAAYADSRGLEGLDASPDKGTFVVIVRHAGAACLRYIEQHRSAWSGVAYLMDDDIPNAWRCADVPLDYGWWTTGRYALVRRKLSAVCDRIWVSTPELQRRYARQTPRLVLPQNPFQEREAAPSGCRRWAYHGTRIHRQELRWLLPVVEAVQTNYADAEFEIFGNKDIGRMFAHIPRVTVVPPKPWREYQAHCASSSLAVGLAPLLPGRFNDARSHVKAFDIANCGAVGVFSDCEPYASALSHAAAALLPDDHSRWIAEILRLLQDDTLRIEHYEKTAAWLRTIGRGETIKALINA